MAVTAMVLVPEQASADGHKHRYRGYPGGVYVTAPGYYYAPPPAYYYPAPVYYPPPPPPVVVAPPSLGLNITIPLGRGR
jgi:hypothetical protein